MSEDAIPKTPSGDDSEADLYKAGIFLFMDVVNPDNCKDVIEFILKQNTEKKRKKRLQLMICSPGGDMPSCFALIDVMKGSKIPIHTVGLGLIASCGLLLFISGEHGHRILTPNTSILSHQFSWAIGGRNMSCLHKSKSLSCLPRECWTTIKSVQVLMKNRLENTCCHRKMFGCQLKKRKS